MPKDYYSDIDGTDVSGDESTSVLLSSTNAKAAWLLFRASDEYRLILVKYSAYGITEEVLKANYILYRIGLQAYHHHDVKKAYRKGKKALSSKIRLRSTKNKRTQALVEAFKEVLAATAESAGGSRGVELLVERFIKRNKDKIVVSAEECVDSESAVIAFKRGLKHSKLPTKFSILRDKLLAKIASAKLNPIKKRSKCPNIKVMKKGLKAAYKAELMRYVAKLIKQAVDDGHSADLEGLKEWLEESKDGVESPINTELLNCLDKLDEELEVKQTKKSVKGELEVELTDFQVPTFVEEYFSSDLLSAVIDNERDVKHACLTWSMYKHSNFSPSVGALVNDYLSLTQDQLRGVVNASYQNGPLCGELVNRGEVAGLYENKRGELGRRERFKVTPAKFHLIGLRTVDCAQRHTVSNVKDEGDALGDTVTTGWEVVTKAKEKIVVSESMEVTIGGSRSDLVRRVGAYSDKSAEDKEKKDKEGSSQTVLAKIMKISSKEYLNCDDARVAELISALHRGKKIKLDGLSGEKRKEVLTVLSTVLQLIMGTEVRRNVMSIPCNLMLLERIANGKLTWKAALDNKTASHYHGGDMPMSMEDAVAASRRVYSEFGGHGLFGSSHQYAGDMTSAGAKGCKQTAELLLRQSQLLMNWKGDDKDWVAKVVSMVGLHYGLQTDRPGTKRRARHAK